MILKLTTIVLQTNLTTLKITSNKPLDKKLKAQLYHTKAFWLGETTLPEFFDNCPKL